jgi:predicted nucleotidyltransferase component of viral defense system
MTSEVFEAQAALLVRALPYVAAKTCFALKGGTAINLFIRDLPRLSVDIDLVYLPIADREASLLGIRSALARIAQSIRKAIPGSAVTENATSDGTRIVVRHRSAQIKIEVTPVLRGTVHPVELRTVRPAAQERFGFAEIQVVSFADLYAGKLIAPSTVNIRGTCLTFKTCLQMKASMTSSFRRSSYISSATIVRHTKFCNRD